MKWAGAREIGGFAAMDSVVEACRPPVAGGCRAAGRQLVMDER